MSARRRKPPSTELDSSRIDALYGLEPVIEPGNSGAGSSADAQGAQFETLQCPYCGEHFQTLADYSAGAAVYVEDCQICCQPIEVSLTVDALGAPASFEARRLD
jgi:hypothetical protein